jgi:hypothetical protein
MYLQGGGRTFVCVVLGFIAGAAIGACLVLIICGYGSWVDGTVAPELGIRLLVGMLFFALPPGINGAIGAGAACRSGECDMETVRILPVSLPALAIVASVWMDAKGGGMLLFISIIVALVAWIGGRIGQRIGYRLHFFGKGHPSGNSLAE